MFDNDKFVPAPPVRLLPEDVWMISFVDIPFSKLPRWPPSAHYGGLGVAFKESFARRAAIRRVSYYKYPNLARDPLVVRFNQDLVGATGERERQLIQEVLQYRKPSRFWPEFNSLLTPLTLTAEAGGGVKVEKLTYSRYEIGYDFEAEREARKVMSENDKVLEFLEDDVLAVVVPDQGTADTVNTFLHAAWTTPPAVMIYPK